jgi:hypothetical protein
MLKTVTGYWLRIIARSNFVGIDFTSDPFPPGTNVYANITLNELNTYFYADSTNPKFSATGYITYWTYYREDGTESEPQQPRGLTQNAIAINNCARINFALEGIGVVTTAQVNIFTF